VYMYCTGGIRCEKASSYLKSKKLCKDVYQLSGGIHKYLEKYPNGHFKGKLYVFDERKTIYTSEQTLSNCAFCGCPWDDYTPCSSPQCYQLVLSCSGCRISGLTYCCKMCHNGCASTKEKCLCTERRTRVPSLGVSESA
jgi:predicted sulfurtransferase